MTRGLTRRALLASSAAASALTGCGVRDTAVWAGGWVGEAVERGHRLRERTALPAPFLQRRADMIIVGGGVAGLAAARAARDAGIDDLVLFELHDTPGGNSRGHPLAALACPLGAHYLPLPGAHAHEVAEWLHEIGVARHEAGRTVYDERHLCHSPQERLFYGGAWHEGLLPPADAGSSALAQYRRFAQQVAQVQRDAAFALPTRRAAWSTGLAALDGQTFAQWLGTRGLDDTHLRWYLDYCCRDDYGAGSETVSAWAGLHYFASRHGFQAPGDEDDEREAVLTWPEGNAWLVQRLAAPLQERLQTGRVVQRVAVQRHGVTVDLWNEAAHRSERWTAPQVVVATPLMVSARIVEPLPEALREAAAVLRYAPWLVANLELHSPLLDRVGVGLAWDNVSYASPGLGYVNAQHQSLSPVAQGGLLTAYRALTLSDRAALMAGSWRHWATQVVDELALTHPDLPAKLVRIDLTRHGHAMSIPMPGVRGHSALKALSEGGTPRLHWAHADLAGYSVFEEAFTAGHVAGRAAARALRRR